jgi:hypothetical protein
VSDVVGFANGARMLAPVTKWRVPVSCLLFWMAMVPVSGMLWARTPITWIRVRHDIKRRWAMHIYLI